MRFHLKFLFPVISAFFLLSCAEAVVKEVDYASMREMPEGAKPRPLKFSGVDILLPPGTEVGLEGGIGRFCSFPRYPVDRNIINKAVDRKYLKQDFHDAMEANGYDVVDSLEIAFRPEDEIQRAEYFIKAKVKDIDLDTCKRSMSQFLSNNNAPGTKGKFYMSVDWSVYDALRRTVVYKTTTEGYTNREIPNLEGLTLLFHDAFEMATHNLAAEEDFYNLIVEGKPAPDHKSSGFGRKKPQDDLPRKYDPREAVNIKAQTLSRQPVPKHIEDIRNANVMIQKSGHGSGFFITKDGHILTNQHVVGDAQRMRIVTKGKKHKLIAEVLRVDKVRDVALLKLEEIPDNLEITTLPIRTEKLTISEDVYAIGVPVDYRSLQDTVSKGIVSAHRLYKDEGVRMPFIQADVKTHKGNSGGALLDEYGNIVGLSVSGWNVPQTNYGVGLNLFVPISQALQTLDITLNGRDVPPYSTREEEREEDSPNESYETPIILAE